MLQLKPLRIAFFGTTEFAAYHLYVLIHCSIHQINVIFTKEKLLLTTQQKFLSIYKIANAYNLPVFQSTNMSIQNIYDILKTLNIDMIIVTSYGLILPKIILDIPKLCAVNVHGSLLPRWRGPAPVQRALEQGDHVTGISIIQMNSGIDTGNILYTSKCQILSTDTSYTLSYKLAYIGAFALLPIINKIILGVCKSTPQNPLKSTYAYKLNKKEARINWNHSATILDRKIRAFNPWPVSYFKTNSKFIRVWEAKINKINQNDLYKYYQIMQHKIKFISPGMILKLDSLGIHVATGSGVLILTVLQIEGKKKTTVKNILNSYYQWFTPYSVLE